MDKLVEELEIVVDREMEHKVEDNNSSSNNKHVVEDHVHVVQIEVISKCLILKKNVNEVIKIVKPLGNYCCKENERSWWIKSK